MQIVAYFVTYQKLDDGQVAWIFLLLIVNTGELAIFLFTLDSYFVMWYDVSGCLLQSLSTFQPNCCIIFILLKIFPSIIAAPIFILLLQHVFILDNTLDIQAVTCVLVKF